MRTTSHATGSAVSADGTTIGYRQLGRGPGIIVVHGSMSSGYYHLQLAEALADAFTLYLLDRRGRGRSGPYRSGDGIRQEARTWMRRSPRPARITCSPSASEPT